ncbi:MAG: TolC family protein [Sandaracinus sp.]
MQAWRFMVCFLASHPLVATAQGTDLDPSSVAAQATLADAADAEGGPRIAPPESAMTQPTDVQALLATLALPPVATEAPLALGDVLASLDAHPTLRGLDARVDAAEGTLLAADGGFDPLLTARGSTTVLGYYEYGRFDTMIQQPTPLWGLTVFAGWRIGRGFNRDLPDYYRYDETLDGGELRGGVTIPLLRDGWIDGRRATLARADLGVDAAREDLAARRLRLRLAATEAYLRWVNAGQRHLVALSLFDLAAERDAQIASRVRSGMIPAIESLENRRVMLERATALVATARAIERTALQLSLYLRDENGAPVLAEAARVPTALSEPDAPPAEDEAAVQAGWASRPELSRLGHLVSQAEIAAELARNQVLPRLDVTLTGSGDLGTTNDPATAYQYGRPVAEGVVSLQFPLALRESRGRLEAAEAEMRAAETDLDLARDTVAVEVRDALSAFRAALRAREVAERSAEVALQVAQAERTRFESGLSTLFVVNQRETAAAQAQATLLDARAEVLLARAQLAAAMGESDDAP